MTFGMEPAAGWNTLMTVDRPANPNVAIIWAANVPFSPSEPSTGFPFETIRGLPATGVALIVIEPRLYTGGMAFPVAQFPLTVGQGFCSYDQYEGQVAPHISSCLVNTMVDGELLNSTVWFGTNNPSSSLVGEANAQLAMLQL